MGRSWRPPAPSTPVPPSGDELGIGVLGQEAEGDIATWRLSRSTVSPTAPGKANENACSVAIPSRLLFGELEDLLDGQCHVVVDPHDDDLVDLLADVLERPRSSGPPAARPGNLRRRTRRRRGRAERSRSCHASNRSSPAYASTNAGSKGPASALAMSPPPTAGRPRGQLLYRLDRRSDQCGIPAGERRFGFQLCCAERLSLGELASAEPSTASDAGALSIVCPASVCAVVSSAGSVVSVAADAAPAAPSAKVAEATPTSRNLGSLEVSAVFMAAIMADQASMCNLSRTEP